MSSKTTVSEESVRKVPAKSLSKYVPILHWLPRYTKFDAVSDLVAGVTLGLTMIPQSIAYAALAGLTAQYGLYSCFIGGFIYAIFGTIKEVSIGPTSLMALLTLEYTRNMPVEFVVLLCFLSGCTELLMGMLNLGFMVDFISIPVTSGFTSATSVIIIVAQLQGILGLRVKAHSVLGNMYKILENVAKVRYPDLILGICSIVFLLAFRKLKDIDFSPGDDDKPRGFWRKPMVKKTLWFLSICRNALVILIAAIISYRLELGGGTPFILSGKVESGLPRVALPQFSSKVGNETYSFFDMYTHYRAGVFVVPLISVLANVAIAKAYASGSTVRATQEMLTLGVCNILGSFVSSMPTCGAFTRSAVSTASGIRTPMAGFYTGIMTLLALSFLTPYFYYIPRATLAAVLITAVIFLMDWRIIKLLWRGCKTDATAAIVTFIVSVLCGVEIGLLVGAIFNLIFFLRPSVRPHVEVVQCKTQLGQKYVMLKPDTGLCYPAVDFFCSKVNKAIEKNKDNGLPLVINCERLRNIDYTAIRAIDGLSKKMNADRNRLWLLHVHPDVVKSIGILADSKHFRFIDDEDKVPCIFYDEQVDNDKEEDAKSKLLKENGENGAFVHTISERNGFSEKTEKLAKNHEDCDEIALTTLSSSKT